MTGVEYRLINEKKVRQILLAHKLCTKQSIAKETGLSIASCRNILEKMLERGEVREEALMPSSGGRPSLQFAYNSQFALGGLFLLRREGLKSFSYRYVIDLKGEILEEKQQEEEKVDESLLVKRMREFQIQYPQIKIWGWGIPGIVKDGNIGISDFPQLRGVNLMHSLQDSGIECLIENDVNAAAYGFAKNNKGRESLVYLYYPNQEPGGAGIVINDQILRGSSNFAGEISFLPLGWERLTQGMLQLKEEEFIRLVVKTVISINAILNPPLIVLSGKFLTSPFQMEIRNRLFDSIPHEHLPKVVFEEDILPSYVSGLSRLTLEMFFDHFYEK